MELAEGKIIADRFRLVRELGVGGMGSVWLAHHIGLDTPCAVKFINSEVAAQADVRTRFDREAKVAAQLRSSHVVQILDYGIWDGFPYIAMEYLEGEELAARLKRVGRLSPLETVIIVSQVARALTKAHAAGLIHRDLKPENIYLVPEDDHEIAKVLDFGIAKTPTPLLNNTTKAGALLGTPHYMSPEQADGAKEVDYRADLWSLGVLTYQCLVGTLPFNGEALGALLVKIIVEEAPLPSTLMPDLPPTFDAWWAKAAAKKPADRFQSAKELADALAIALGVSATMAPGMVPFAPSTSGSFSLSMLSMPSMPSLTPPARQGPKPGLDFDVDSVLANIAPTTGGAVSIDPAPSEHSKKQKRVPLALGIAVGAVALCAGVGLALWGNSLVQGPRPPGSAQASGSEAPLASGAAPASATAAATSASAAPGAAPDAGSSAALSGTSASALSSSAPVAAGSAAPSASVPGSKLPIRPRKPKEKDFGF